MTIKYVIDVYNIKNIEVFNARWLTKTQSIEGICQAELFVKVSDIRDSEGYNALSLISYDDNDISSGTVPWYTELSLNEHTTRTSCSINTELVIQELHNNDDMVWLVNPFEITNQQRSEVIEMWNNAKDFLVNKQGLVNARLFKSDMESKYNLFNIAAWLSSEDIQQALDDKGYSSHKGRSMHYKLHPSLCKRVYNIKKGKTHE